MLPSERRARHLGSWSMFSDIAGQVSCSPDNPIVTIAAVGVAPELVRRVRRELRAGFHEAPVKWKHGGTWASVDT